MATKPELNIAEYGKDISSTQYNDNFDKLNDYIEAVSNELMLKVNTINSQLSSKVLSNLQSIYPVGSLYIGVTETCPIANLFGTWEKIQDGLVLQNSDSEHEIGTTIEAGLPNITGSIVTNQFGTSGAFYENGTSWIWGGGRSDNQRNGGKSFDASRASSIYGKSNTVQPPAYVVNIWKRTA